MSKKVTGIGGVFFKCDDPKVMREWYGKNLGFETDQYGAMFKGRDFENPDKVTNLQWSTMSKDSDYFNPSDSQFMINYRVENLEALLKEFKANGITILDEIATYDYGKFLHIMDPEGNKIELWEPVDKAFE